MIAGKLRAQVFAILPLGALVTASACAVSTPATLISAQSDNLTPSSIELLGEDDETDLRARFHNALRNSMGERSIAVESGADLIGDFAISARDAKLGVHTAQAPVESTATQGTSFKSRIYHTCKPDRLSATLVLYSRASGAIRARSQGEFLACPSEFEELDNLAQLLVEQALGE